MSEGILIIEGPSRDTVFYDSNGDEYLRIGADNVPADVYERFTSWCMHLPPVHDAEVRRLTDENALLIESADSLMNTRIELEKEVQRLTDENNALRKSAQNAAFYRSCALSGEVPNDGDEPHPSQDKGSDV